MTVETNLQERDIPLKRLNHELYWSQKHRVAFVSFPRSGSNWACAMISAMLQRAVAAGQTVGLTGRSGYSICPIDSPKISYADVSAKNYFSGIVKTHSHVWDENTHVIYMFRDARETLASFRHWHRQRCPETEFNAWKDPRYVHTFLTKLLTDWWRAVRFGTRYPRNIIFVRYKDLLENPVPPLQQIADFLGLSVGESDLAAIVQDHTLAKMQAKKPKLIYRDGRTNHGRGNFGKHLLVYIALRSCVPYLMLCASARRSVEASIDGVSRRRA